ncbi:ribosome biogenesis protein SLX9 [Scheffersomyces coipomensis]|uniref:ribosome biogenesis protein SLX9 n=1 Tax=Scheffersomyces coipomensis TaxID=1788519 RepID=UPI00315CE127
MAGIKKKTSLRDKTNKKASLANKISEFKHEVQDGSESFHENPMLKLSKITKREKQQSKSDAFNRRLSNKITFNTSNSISKSSLRRQKKKAKEELKPKMNELLLSLPSTSGVVKGKNEDEKAFIAKKSLNKPNANKRTGHQRILIQENKNFKNVLTNSEFKASPFSALKNVIQQNLQHR